MLKNIRSLDGGIVLIDEPELSMHPKWQQKVLEFYRNLFNVDGKDKIIECDNFIASDTL